MPFMKRKIRVGLDFDGVVAYNPFRIVRPIVAFTKKRLYGEQKLKFWYPTKKWQQFLWLVAHESSVFPAFGIKLLRKMVAQNRIEIHLITARYSFLDDHLNKWLGKKRLRHLFKSINLNKNDEQPHIFKEKIISKYRLDYFVEDNLDIVRYLNENSKLKTQNSKLKIFWIYNVLDRDIKYKYKFPYLKKALESIK